MPRMQQMTPMLLVSNLEASLQFIGDVLGFDAPFVMSEYRYAYISREGVAVRLLEIGPDNIVYVNEAQGTTYDEIYQMLTSEKADSEETELQITVDPESNHEMRIMVVDAATQVGFQSIKSLIKEVN